MIDRALGIGGVAISILTGFAQWLWPDIPTWLAAGGFTLGAILIIVAVLLLLRSVFRGEPKEAISDELPPSRGGSGGHARVAGSGIAIGGAGGNAGVPGAGKGGDGGNAEVEGDGFALGGEGGEAGQADRGGRGGRSPLKVLGVPNQQLPDGSWLWDKGRGGDGASPQNAEDSDSEPGRALEAISREFGIAQQIAPADAAKLRGCAAECSR